MHKTVAALIAASLTMLPVGAAATQPALAQRATPTHALAFQPDRETLSVLRFPPGAQATLRASSSSVERVVLSADASRAAWVYYGGEQIPSNRIMVRSSDGKGKARNVLAKHRDKFDFIDSFDWSPDGRKLAFIAEAADGSVDMWMIAVNGRSLKKIAADLSICPDTCGRVIWAPNGKSIAWFSETYEPNFSTQWERLWLATKNVTGLPDGFFGWSDNMKWMGQSSSEDGRIILDRTNGRQKKVLRGPRSDDAGEGAPDIFFGVGNWIGYRTDEENDEGEERDRYVAVNFRTADVVTLAAADPTRGGTFDFR